MNPKNPTSLASKALISISRYRLVMVDFSDLDIKSALQEMNEYAFEEFVAELWSKQGWETEVTTGAGDKGIDVIARMEYPVEQTHLIQAKRYTAGNKVSSPDIQQYSSLPQQEDADSVIVVTTSSFTKQASNLAASLNVKLIDSDQLCDIIRKESAFDILDRFSSLDTSQKDEPLNSGEINNSENIEKEPDKPQSKLVREKLEEAFIHHMEATDEVVIGIDFIYDDVERAYYNYVGGIHGLYYLDEAAFETTLSMIRDGMFETITVQEPEEGTIQFWRGQNPSLADVEDEVELFTQLLEEVFDKNLGNLTRIKAEGGRTDDRLWTL